MFPDEYPLSVSGMLLQSGRESFKFYKGQLLPAWFYNQTWDIWKDYTQYVKAEFMGCLWLIIKSPDKMQLKSTEGKAKERRKKH